MKKVFRHKNHFEQWRCSKNTGISKRIAASKKAAPWVSKIPKRYKQNTTSGDLHGSIKISSNFDKWRSSVCSSVSNDGLYC